MNKKKMRKKLIKLQNQIGKKQGKTLWLQMKKEMINAVAE